MTSGFEVLGHSRAVQLHWLRRVGAYFVDLLIVLVATWSVLTVSGFDGTVLLSLAAGVVFVEYSICGEALFGKTIGKHAFGLEVRSLRGSITIRQAAARNAPKFFWYIFPILDLLISLVGSGDPRQRFTDRAVGTTVVWRQRAVPPRAVPS